MLLISQIRGKSVNLKRLVLEEEVTKYKEFFKFWAECPVPVYCVQLESLIVNPVRQMRDLAAFIIGTNKLDNTKLGYILDKGLPEVPDEFRPVEFSKKIHLIGVDEDRLDDLISSRLDKLGNRVGFFEIESDKVKEFNQESCDKAKMIVDRLITANFSISFNAIVIG